MGLKVVRQGLTIRMKELGRIWTSVLGGVAGGLMVKMWVVIQGCPGMGEMDLGLQGPYL